MIREIERALRYGIFLTPTVLKPAPSPLRKFVGTLKRIRDVGGTGRPATRRAVHAGNAMTTPSRNADPSRQARLAALIESLHEIEQETAATTAGNVDTVSDQAGRSFVLPGP